MELARILLAAPKSGSGKTTVVCALLQALQNRGVQVAAFKSGPDYIDPMFHSRVLQTPSRNLDLFLLGRGKKGAERARSLLGKNAVPNGLAVLEGAMGYYDGIGTGSEASAYELAKATQSPAILVVDGRGSGVSLGAILKGLAAFHADSQVQGFIVNRVKPMVYHHFKQAWKEASGLQALGCLPELPDCQFSSRHLGLITAGEIADLQKIMQRLAGQAEKYLDIEAILALAKTAPSLLADEKPSAAWPKIPVHLAVAKDEAFCFYYQDALDLLQQMGATLCYFSPLHDRSLPPCDGLYLGGGYPELYAAALSENQTMRQSIHGAIAKDLPCIAECGGFMYLHQAFRAADGKTYPWCGVIGGETYMTETLQHFGYVTLTAEKDTLLCAKGTEIPAHEFHYSASTNGETSFTIQKAAGSRHWAGIYAEGNLIAGYPHLHFCGQPQLVRHFLLACQVYARKETT